MRKTNTTESAAPNILAEVLAADDDDGNLYNGTPNDTALCSIYANRNIYLSIDTPLCDGDFSGGVVSMPDCDQSGNLNLLDFLCFGDLYALGDPAADLNNDGQINTADMRAYQILYTRVVGSQTKENMR